MSSSNVQCDSYKDVMKNYSHDERFAPSFCWHLSYGPGHIFGPPGSRYFRSNWGIPCQVCEVTFCAEKELVRHLRVFHTGVKHTRTPNLIYCYKVDLAKVADTQFKDTLNILLHDENRTKRSTKFKLKSTQPKPVQPESDNPKSKKVSKSKEASKKPSKSKDIPKAKKALKPRKDVKQKESDVLPAAVNPSPSTSAVDAGNQVASVSNGSESSVVNPASGSSVPSVVAADSSSDLPALPLLEMESSASGSKAAVSGLLDHSPGEASSTTGGLEPVSAEDVVRILDNASPIVFELEKFRNSSLDIRYTENLIPSTLKECSEVLRQVLVSHYEISESYRRQFGELYK